MWETLLRPLDDIKDSVRDAAASCVNVLSKVSVRLCDPHSSPASEAREAAFIVLPFLLHKVICVLFMGIGVSAVLLDAFLLSTHTYQFIRALLKMRKNVKLYVWTHYLR